MPKCPQWIYAYSKVVFWLLVPVLLAGCLATRGIVNVESRPYPLVYEDDSTERFSDSEDTVFIEVRRRKVFHARWKTWRFTMQRYSLAGRSLGRVTPRTISRLTAGTHTKWSSKQTTSEGENGSKPTRNWAPGDAPPGWTLTNIEDPATGKRIPVLYGPVIPTPEDLVPC